MTDMPRLIIPSENLLDEGELRRQLEEWRQHPQITLPMSVTITPVVRLYVFRPYRHGPSTFMVAAESEEAARAAVQPRIEQSDWTDMIDSYTLEVYPIGQVADNDND